MIGGSYGVISKRFPEYSVGALLAVVVAQGKSDIICLRRALDTYGSSVLCRSWLRLDL